MHLLNLHCVEATLTSSIVIAASIGAYQAMLFEHILVFFRALWTASISMNNNLCGKFRINKVMFSALQTLICFNVGNI